MSFLRRVFGGESESDEPVQWSWPRIGILPVDVQSGNFSLVVVGAAQYQKEIKAARKLHQSKNIPVYLNREPRNSDDPGAVAVMSALQQRLGYLKGEDTGRYFESLDEVAAAGFRATCVGRVTDGEPGEPPGLTIDLSGAEEIKLKLEQAVRDAL